MRAALFVLVFLTAVIEWSHDRAYRRHKAANPAPPPYDWAREGDL